MGPEIIVVGTGQFYKEWLGPAIAALQSEGRANLAATVDLKAADAVPTIRGIDDTLHLQRREGVALSDLLADLHADNPVVVLGHSNESHVNDAWNLLDSGFRVLMEKPYALTLNEMMEVHALARMYQGRVAFGEYYLTFKAAPLLALEGMLKPDSFYFTRDGTLTYRQPGWERLTGGAPADIFGKQGKLEELIGKPRYVLSEVLEGEDLTGIISHRGPHLSDIRIGGGMIQDLGVHALTTIMALDSYFGKLDSHFENGEIRIAECRQYAEAVSQQHHIPPEFIGESYAEAKALTYAGLPISLAVGKYVLPNVNQRRLVVVGEHGSAHLDLSSCTLSLTVHDADLGPVLQAPKGAQKYYAVLRSALEQLEGNDPFLFPSTGACLNAQELVLVMQRAAYSSNAPRARYEQHAMPGSIFKD